MENTDYILQHISSLLARYSDQILLEQLGIGYSQFKILRVISDELISNQKQISDELGQTEASVSRQIKLLIKKGLINKSTDPNNKRARQIKITDKGIKLAEASQDALTKFYNGIFYKLDAKKQSELKTLLEEVRSLVRDFEKPSYVEYITRESKNLPLR